MKPKSRRRSSPRPVTGAEIDAIHQILDQRGEVIENLQRTCTIQFERIALMQAQLDHLERLIRIRQPVSR